MTFLEKKKSFYYLNYFFLNFKRLNENIYYLGHSVSNKLIVKIDSFQFGQHFSFIIKRRFPKEK